MYNERLKYNRAWREKIGKRLNPGEYDWRIHLHTEFVEFLEEVASLAALYDWDMWGGGVKNYAVTLSQAKKDGKSISIKMISGANYKYYASFEKIWNPNNANVDHYKLLIGENMEEALKYIHEFLMDNKYQREWKDKRTCFMGGAYERYPLALHWERERVIEELEEHQLVS